jgi:hypothetical protein
VGGREEKGCVIKERYTQTESLAGRIMVLNTVTTVTAVAWNTRSCPLCSKVREKVNEKG